MNHFQLMLASCLVFLATLLGGRQVSAQGHVFTFQELEQKPRGSLTRLDSMRDALPAGFGSGLPPIYPSIRVRAGFDDDDDDSDSDEDERYYEEQALGYKRLMLDGYHREALNMLDRLLLESTTSNQVSGRMLELRTDRASLLHTLGMNLASLAELHKAQTLAQALGVAPSRLQALMGSVTGQLEFDQN